MSCGVLTSTWILVTCLAAQPDPMRPDPDGVRPIAAEKSVFTEDLTWMEVRDAMRGGADTILIATGGVEQNGPYLVTGKHNFVLRAATEAIARKLKNTLVAPIVPFVPEGDLDPPTGHMKYPGTVSVSEDTYQRLLTDICVSMRTHGFKKIVLIGDSGGNQVGLKSVAETLNAKWNDNRSKVYFIPEFYNYNDLGKWVQQQGINQVSEGLHDDFPVTAMLMSIDPNLIRTKQRLAAGKFRINGVELAPAEKTIEWGKKIIEHRAEITVAAIRKAVGE